MVGGRGWPRKGMRLKGTKSIQEPSSLLAMLVAVSFRDIRGSDGLGSENSYLFNPEAEILSDTAALALSDFLEGPRRAARVSLLCGLSGFSDSC